MNHYDYTRAKKAKHMNFIFLVGTHSGRKSRVRPNQTCFCGGVCKGGAGARSAALAPTSAPMYWKLKPSAGPPPQSSLRPSYVRSQTPHQTLSPPPLRYTSPSTFAYVATTNASVNILADTAAPTSRTFMSSSPRSPNEPSRTSFRMVTAFVCRCHAAARAQPLVGSVAP
jgi:hypothetical protein